MNALLTGSRFNYQQQMMQAAMTKNAASRASAGGAGKNSAVEADFSVEIDVSVEIGVGEINETQTVEDVKKEFYDYLDSLTLSPGLSSTPISVNVTDAAFEKMLEDPEYKQKMKDLCARDLCDPNWVKLPPTGINITIDADCEEEYLATSWSGAGAKVNSDGFWTRRTKKREESEKILEKRAQEKHEMMDFLQERADERKRLTNEFFQFGSSSSYSSPSTSSGYSASAGQGASSSFSGLFSGGVV